MGGEKCMDSGSTDIEVSANNDDVDLSVHLIASLDGGVDSVSASKKIDVDGNSLTITPRFSVTDEAADVVVAYNAGDTHVELTASQDSQEVVIDHTMDSTSIKLTASADNLLTATLKPNESIEVEWKDDAWTAELKAGLDGTTVNGLSISTSREVHF